MKTTELIRLGRIDQIAPVERITREYVRPPKLNVLIADVSGSMYWAMKELAEDTIQRVKALPKDDAVLIGIFSSQGWFRWITSRELSGPDDYSMVENLIRQNFHVVGLTCFSEIVNDTPQAIKPFLTKFPVVTITFMSDGHPVVSDPRKEEAALLEAANELKQYVTAGAVVAYGDYANRPLLNKLATQLGVEMVSTNKITDVGGTFDRLSKGKTASRRKVTVPSAQVAFVVDGEMNVSPIESGEVWIGKDSSVFYVTPESKQSFDVKEDAQFLSYAAALVLLGQDKIDEALELMSDVGDIAIVKALANALTNSELAQAEAKIRACVADPTMRFLQGRKVGCLPKEDAFDLLDLINLLTEDEDALLYPRHEEFKIQRIGRPSIQREGYPVFKANPDVSVPLSRLTGHQSELNLSIGVNIPGTVDLPDTVEMDGKKFDRRAVNLPETINSFIYRNYGLVANALPATTKLPMSFSETTFDKLVAEGVLSNTLKWSPSAIFILDLTKIPVCNRQRGKDSADFGNLAKMAVKSLELGSIIKVLKAKRDELDPGREAERPIEYTDAQFEFLEACGFRRDLSFSPPTDPAPTTDVLDIRILEAKVQKGSPVSMNDFREMLNNSKKLNWVGSLMKVGQNLIDSDMPKTKGEAVQWLIQNIKAKEVEKRQLDAKINSQRFAAVLSGAWAKNFKQDEVVMDAGNAQVKFVFRVVQKDI